MKRSQPRRDWSEANIKRTSCRVCGANPTELAHICGRTFDWNPPLKAEGWKVGTVAPDRIVALCPEHHRLFDEHRFDLLPYLTLDEQLQAVADLGGIELARIRLASISREARAA